MKISLAMIVKDEESNLEECLNSVKEFVDEIVIVDTGSTDNTKNIALSYTRNVYDFIWCDDFAKARNFSLEKCTSDWILVMDADDRLIEGNKEIINAFIESNEDKVGLIERISKYYSNNEESYSREYESRIFKKGLFYKGEVHEQINSNVKREKINLIFSHSGYEKNDKSERNKKILLKMLEDNNEDEYVIYQIARTLFVDKNFQEANKYFEKAYKLVDKNKIYYKNLVISYIYSSIEEQNFQTGLDLINDNYEMYKNSAEFHFAEGIFYMNLILFDTKTYGEYLYLIENAYLKCLELGEREEDSVIGVGTFKADYNLGVYYETLNNIEKANYYYKQAYEMGYEKAESRIK